VGPRIRFEALYHAHSGAVRAFALRRVDAAWADDVVAEVFLVVWRRLDDVPAQPLPWLLGVARRIVANGRRGDHRAAALRERLTATAGSAPVTEDISESPVMRALGSLSERDQEVLLLVAWDGLSREQAAAVLGTNPGTLAVRLHRARHRLTRALNSESPTATAVDQEPTRIEVS
jgi:RNA polymerase sigma-70 factor (ECF subfamily)